MQSGSDTLSIRFISCNFMCSMQGSRACGAASPSSSLRERDSHCHGDPSSHLIRLMELQRPFELHSFHPPLRYAHPLSSSLFLPLSLSFSLSLSGLFFYRTPLLLFPRPSRHLARNELRRAGLAFTDGPVTELRRGPSQAARLEPASFAELISQPPL